MKGLKGKNVMETGGASGIGQATASRFIAEHCHVCILDCSHAARSRVKRELPEFAAVIDADVSNWAQVLDVNRKIPLGRHAESEEIAALFAFLASDDAAFATGTALVMDGGGVAG